MTSVILCRQIVTDGLALSAVAWVSGNGRVSSWRFTAVKIAADAAGVGATEVEEKCKEVSLFCRSLFCRLSCAESSFSVSASSGSSMVSR